MGWSPPNPWAAAAVLLLVALLPNVHSQSKLTFLSVSVTMLVCLFVCPSVSLPSCVSVFVGVFPLLVCLFVCFVCLSVCHYQYLGTFCEGNSLFSSFIVLACNLKKKKIFQT